MRLASHKTHTQSRKKRRYNCFVVILLIAIIDEVWQNNIQQNFYSKSVTAFPEGNDWNDMISTL